MSDEVVIVGNGAFPRNTIALEALQNADCIICCDGAVNKLTAHGFEPSVVVGDCDSMSEEDLTKWKDILVVDKSEAYNDLQKALKYCLSHNISKATMVGCDGLRDDHFIANISIMVTYAHQIDLTMIAEHGLMKVIDKTTTFTATPGQQVSVFTTDKELPITFEGLKYPVKERCFKHLWEGSLNEALTKSFQIILHKPGSVLVYVANIRQ